MKVILVDCNYVEAEFAGCYLLVQEHEGKKRGLFIECNTNYAIPYLVKAAELEGLSREQIDGLIITHVHLDHAGGAGLFLKEFPNAVVYAHPKAARHVIDPSKLISSATLVYGDAFMQKLYGTIYPAPNERVVLLEDGAPVEWLSIKLETKHTRGHANHHLCVLSPETKSVTGAIQSLATLFTGDSFGVSYPQVNRKRGLVMTVSTSPTDFDGAEALKTIDWVESLNQRAGGIQIALTHFGFIQANDVSKAAKSLRDQIRFSIDLVAKIKRETAAGSPLNETQVTEHIHDWFIQYYAAQGIHLDSEDLKILRLDFSINAQGLLFAATRT